MDRGHRHDRAIGGLTGFLAAAFTIARFPVAARK